MSTKLHLHHALPAPVVHAGFSVTQSKSHVLAGVQDAYWSDDEAEDAECPLCLEEMDISDLNFKPCICGYQICRFCWHHIKENLNKRCPACRRVYTDDAVEFKPIATQDHKRLTQQKKQRERERKELDALGRRHLANVRVVQRNIVYVVGIGPRFAKEELIPTLRSNEYFGQYGKITKILLVKRTPSGGGAPVVGLYITYHRREDAARAIGAVDGTVSPGGGKELMRASYGTTKYCMAFLRGVTCGDHSCMNLHEWGDEKDCFTKEDLTTLKHTMKATESRSRNGGVATKKNEEQDVGLPRAAAWAQKGTTSQGAASGNNAINTSYPLPSASGITRPSRRGGALRQQRNSPAIVNATINDSRTPNARAQPDRKVVATPPQISLSRPSTPASSLQQRPGTAGDIKSSQQKKESITPPQPSQSPSISVTEDEQGSSSRSVAPLAARPSSTDSVPSYTSGTPSIPPGLPVVPPGLSAPPGIPTPSRPPRVETQSPQTPLLAYQTSYQMSTAARALLDDVKARRESALPVSMGASPFPDFDRTLQTLSGGDNGGFSFNFDPKLAVDEAENDENTLNFDVEANTPFHGTYVDAFPALRPPVGLTLKLAPPGLPYPHNANRAIYDPLAIRTSTPSQDKQSASGSNYAGSFNPFADTAEETAVSSSTQRQYSSGDDDSSRKVSRFGFARGRQGSTAASSPLHVSSPLSNSNSDHHSIYNSGEGLPMTPGQWSGQSRQEYNYMQSGSAMGSPIVQHTQANSMFPPPGRFQPFDSGVSEAQLRDLIQSSRERVGSAGIHEIHSDQSSPFQLQINQQPFSDPAIMSASFIAPDTRLSPMVYGPPPGLSYPQGGPPGLTAANPYSGDNVSMESNGSNNRVQTKALSVLSPVLSSSDFPALTASTSDIGPNVLRDELSTEALTTVQDAKAHEKEERKAARKAAAMEKAAERQKVAQEKAAAKALEKAKVTQQKALAKETEILKATQKEVEEKASKDKERELPAKADADQVTHMDGEKASGLDKEHKKPILKNEKSSKRVVSNTSKAQTPEQPTKAPEPVSQVPLLSKKPKKNKPVVKTSRGSKEDEGTHDETPAPPPSSTPDSLNDLSLNSFRPQQLNRSTPTSVEELLEEIDLCNPGMDLSNHPFFDIHKINPAAKMPLEYGPLVHALSALSVGGGSFANNMPSGSIDNAVSSFQQLLETLTQTISDLLRLLPRTTWDDSSSFDGVLRDMLKGDDFLDDGGDESHGKEDEVAALTLALERRARWMEVQLSKLEELHRDINTAAVRAVLSFNDNGWDRNAFLPRIGNTLRRFDNIGMVEEEGAVRLMTANELEKKLVVAKEAAAFAEVEVRELMEKMQGIKPVDCGL